RMDGAPWVSVAGVCATAQFDVEPALGLAARAARLPERDNRAASLRFLLNTQLPGKQLLPIFTAMTADPDLAVAALAHGGMARYLHRNATDEQYRALDALARRLPEKAASADAVGIDPEPVSLDRGAVVATMIHSLGDRPLEPLLEFLPSMDPHTRSALARKAAERKRLDGDLRRTI